MRVWTTVKPVSGGDLEISASVGSTGRRGSKDMPVHADEQDRTFLQNTIIGYTHTLLSKLET